MSRLINVKKNMISGLVSQFTVNLLGFINRTIFIYILGTDYLGLSGLFTNILSVLSLAELGIGDAITFALYRPLSENNNEKLSMLMSFYRKAYKMIGIIIFLLGISLMPVLKYIIHFDNAIDINYYYIYLLFLLNSCISYIFYSYRISLINAAQKNYLLLPYNLFFSVFSFVFQVAVLILFKNYYVYLLVPIFSEVLKNFIISRRIKKEFSNVNFNTNNKLKKSERKKLLKNIYALAMTKISSIIYSSSDNIIISTFLNTSIVGLYSNYTLIIGLLNVCINILFNSLKSSVGDLNVNNNKEHKKDVFNKILFANRWMYYLFSICLYELFNPFITLWIGKNYTLSQEVVLMIVLSFLIPGLNNTISVYKDACGLFWQTRYRTLITALVNIFLSIFLIHYLGLVGTFIGTILAYLLTIYTIDPMIVYREIFEQSIKEYYVDFIKSFFYFVIVFVIVHIMCTLFVNNVTIINFIIKSILCLMITNILFYFIYKNTNEFEYYKNKILKKNQ